ncbi:hypothetical protein BJ912DRAFT_927775 [Pholiota molesta]|nr:hypothetical protein BJ912DRAFT_927775 [Pholiota molesta]
MQHSHSPFTVAGMSSSTSSHSSPNLNTWGSTSTGGPLASSFGDSLSQSRSHYQPGYLVSTSQSNNLPQGKQRVDEAPVVQTKAKMNQILSRVPLQISSSRQRQALDDEDAPPTTSINDIPNEINLESPAHFQQRKPPREKSPLSPFSASRRGANGTSPPSSKPNQPVYIVVFGYPPDKYSVAVEYFTSLGETTNPELNTEISNCFKLGYLDPSDAMRAVRKNGEVVTAAGWLDPSQLDAAFQPSARSAFAANHPQRPLTPEATQWPSTNLIRLSIPAKIRQRLAPHPAGALDVRVPEDAWYASVCVEARHSAAIGVGRGAVVDLR